MDPEPISLPSAGLRKMAVIGPAAFMNSLGVGSINLGLIFIVKEVFNAPPSVVGWLGALWSFVYFFSCLIFQRLTSRLVPRSSMIFMLVASAAVFLVFCVFPSLNLALVTYALFGLLIAFFWPPMMGWLSRGLEGKDLSRATSLFNFSWSIGGIISPYLAGMLSQKGKFLPVYFSILSFTANAIFLYVSRRFLRDADERPVRKPEPEIADSDASTPLRFHAWVTVFVLYAAVGIFANIFPLFARSDLGLSESRTGLMLTIRASATTAGFIFFGRFAFWRFRKRLLILPTILAVLLGLLLAFTESSLSFLVLGLTVLGFVSSWAYNNSMFYGASGAPDRDRRMTIHEAVLTAGQVIGSLVGGILYQTASMRLVFLFISALALAGIGLQVLLYRSRFGEPASQRPPLVR